MEETMEENETIPSEPFWSIHPRNRLKFSRRFVLFFIQFSLIFVFWHWKIDVAQEPLKYHIALHLFMLWATNAWSIAIFTFLIAFMRQEMEAYMSYSQMRIKELDEKIAAHQKESDQALVDELRSIYPNSDPNQIQDIVVRSRNRLRPSIWSYFKRIFFDV